MIYHPEAEAELVEAAQFYERRVPTLGLQFLQSVELATGVILDAPERWRIVEGNVRRYLMPRFPFAIYYRVMADDIRILAIKHHSRRQKSWQHRLVD